MCEKCGSKMQEGSSMCMRCGHVKEHSLEQVKEKIENVEVYEQEKHDTDIIYIVVFCVLLFLSLCTLSISFGSIIKFFFSRNNQNYTLLENVLEWVKIIATPIVPVLLCIIDYKLMKKNNLIDLKKMKK